MVELSSPILVPPPLPNTYAVVFDNPRDWYGSIAWLPTAPYDILSFKKSKKSTVSMNFSSEIIHASAPDGNIAYLLLDAKTELPSLLAVRVKIYFLLNR